MDANLPADIRVNVCSIVDAVMCDITFIIPTYPYLSSVSQPSPEEV